MHKLILIEVESRCADIALGHLASAGAGTCLIAFG
jgi:hypothetical protein